MAEQGLLDLLRVQDPLEQGCDEGVAEAVESEPLVGEPGPCQQRLVPPLVEVVVVCLVADAVREDEVVVASPGGTAVSPRLKRSHARRGRIIGRS
jgi:hypothetical protein